ncbi:hypothetical protein L9F63_019632 [Diploptera punctata]|uniref:Uncharacterized protein n=1 Tax=Diploptera punctata TaxID=6984 RepID=A0AAD7ZTW1_DIPPU|nr:hypothetical protein L9F63_019632 [Diploptera punctata]
MFLLSGIQWRSSESASTYYEHLRFERDTDTSQDPDDSGHFVDCDHYCDYGCDGDDCENDDCDGVCDDDDDDDDDEGNQNEAKELTGEEFDNLQHSEYIRLVDYYAFMSSFKRRMDQKTEKSVSERMAQRVSDEIRISPYATIFNKRK